jgi:hypothetical protein
VSQPEPEQAEEVDEDALNTRALMRNDPPFRWDALWAGELWLLAYESKELAEAWLDGAVDGYRRGLKALDDR